MPAISSGGPPIVQLLIWTELMYHPLGRAVAPSSYSGSVGGLPPGGPNVHTMGMLELHPRSMASPAVYGAAKRVATAAGVATERAWGRLPVAQLETSADAAASALGWGAAGSATVVVVVAGALRVVDVVDAPPCPVVQPATMMAKTGPRMIART